MSADSPAAVCANCGHTWSDHWECTCPHEACDELICQNKCGCLKWEEADTAEQQRYDEAEWRAGW